MEIIVKESEDVVIGDRTYRYAPSGNQYNYVGPDGERYRKHDNGGGLVGADTVVWDVVHVGPQCRVFGGAELHGAVRLTGGAQVGGTVRAVGHVTFAGHGELITGSYVGPCIVTMPKAA